MIDLSRRVVATPDTLSAPADDELVFLSLDRGKYFGLDDVGAVVWRRLTESSSISEAVDRLVEEFDVERETLERDVAGLVEELVEKGLARLE
jgi:hypothetical protein